MQEINDLLGKIEIIKVEDSTYACSDLNAAVHFWIVGGRTAGWPDYTHSRDDLKKVRPQGWFFHVSPCRHGRDKILFDVDAYKILDHGAHVGHKGFTTEESAELHAIIQAIDYDRKKP